MTPTPEAILKTWTTAINTGDLEGLLGLYADTAVLVPTFSNRLLQKPETIRQYFELLASREELSLALHEKTLVVQPIVDAIYSVGGIYCWRFAVDGELLSFEARFSLLMDCRQAKPILHHHSSQIPRTL